MLLYPLIRDQKAAGSNPATSTHGNLCSARVSIFCARFYPQFYPQWVSRRYPQFSRHLTSN